MKDSSRKRNVRKFWIIILAPLAALALLLGCVGIFADIPSFEELEHPNYKLASLVIAEDGEMLADFHIENRTFVEYENISPNLINATVATEDERFYEHCGIDFRSLGRVAVKTLLMHDSSQGGGSTITQQLAKTLYPRKEGGKLMMIWVKMKEWITAVKIERDYTKDEIITMYLNAIFFGSSAHGIKAAAETFFAKDPSQLTVEESATLIGMVNKPTRYNPVLNPEKSMERRNFVISKMVRPGFRDNTGELILTQGQADSIKKLPINVSKYQVQDHNAGVAPYFRDRIKQDFKAKKPKRSKYRFEEDFAADSLRWADDPIYGWLEKNKKPDGSKYDLDRDGLRIYTTINYKMQLYAEAAVAEHLRKHQKEFDREMRYRTNRPFLNSTKQKTVDAIMKRARKGSERYRLLKNGGKSEEEILAEFKVPVKMRVFSWNRKGYCDTMMTPDDSIKYYKGLLRAGFVAMEPLSGHVKAYVGGPNFRYMKFDHVRQSKRQIGSTIKPFIYSMALSQGLSPCDRLIDAPQTFVSSTGRTWTPRSGGGGGGIITLRQGLARSSNNVSAFLVKQFGPSEVVRMMKTMGVESHLEEVNSLCVGAADVELFNMVACYNIFPSGGEYITPQYITKVEDSNGKVLTETSSRRRYALSTRVNATMVQMMRGVVDGGTGTRLRHAPYNLTGEIAGKTGTTNNNSDGWFICYTPSIVAGAWCGCEDMQIHFQSGALGQGAAAALPICGLFLKKCIDDGTVGINSKDHFRKEDMMSMNCATSGEFIGPGSEEAYYSTTEEEEIEDFYFN